jgi:hypothetical protein
MPAIFTAVRIRARLGLGRKNLERSLVNWRRQLDKDRSAGVASARLAANYCQISALLAKLGLKSEAADEYRHGMTLMEGTFKGHPFMREFYNGYLALLNKQTDAVEIANIRARRDALPRH